MRVCVRVFVCGGMGRECDQGGGTEGHIKAQRRGIVSVVSRCSDQALLLRPTPSLETLLPSLRLTLPSRSSLVYPPLPCRDPHIPPSLSSTTHQAATVPLIQFLPTLSCLALPYSSLPRPAPSSTTHQAAAVPLIGVLPKPQGEVTQALGH